MPPHICISTASTRPLRFHPPVLTGPLRPCCPHVHAFHPHPAVHPPASPSPQHRAASVPRVPHIQPLSQPLHPAARCGRSGAAGVPRPGRPRSLPGPAALHTARSIPRVPSAPRTQYAPCPVSAVPPYPLSPRPRVPCMSCFLYAVSPEPPIPYVTLIRCLTAPHSRRPLDLVSPVPLLAAAPYIWGPSLPASPITGAPSSPHTRCSLYSVSIVPLILGIPHHQCPLYWRPLLNQGPV